MELQKNCRIGSSQQRSDNQRPKLLEKYIEKGAPTSNRGCNRNQYQCTCTALIRQQRKLVGQITLALISVYGSRM